MNNFTLITYPRSGSHLFLDVLHQLIYYKDIGSIDKTHDLNYDAKNVLTIARNPLDTIASSSAMRLQYASSSNYKDVIKERSETYLKYYNFFNETNPIIISYENLYLNPVSSITKFANRMGMTIISSLYEPTSFDDFKNNHLLSSKKNVNYDEIREITKDFVSDEHIRLFNLINDRALG